MLEQFASITASILDPKALQVFLRKAMDMAILIT